MICRECYVAALCSIFFVILARPCITVSLPKEIDTKLKKTIQKGIIRLSLKLQHVLSHTTDENENITDTNKNIIFAPINIVASLTTLLLGSEAATEEEILNLLEFYPGKDNSEKYSHLKIHAILGELFANFTAESSLNSAVETKTNRGIFYQTETELKEDFVKYAKQLYNNELIPLNFRTGDDTPVKAINDWMSNHTEERITEVVKPPLPVDMNLIMLNTIFFNGEWDFPFYVKSTMSNFYLEKGGPPVKVKTMLNAGSIYYYYNSNYSYSVVGLPYKGDETVMYIILPDRGQKLKNVLSKIRSDDLHEIMNSTERDTDSTYTLPYMHMSDSVGLKGMLEKLGVVSVFDPIKSNLVSIGENLGLYLSEMVHNVNLNVTEAGSTGAANTVVITETAFPRRKVVLINRPFSFYVIHRPSGVISFWGSIYDPRKFQ